MENEAKTPDSPRWNGQNSEWLAENLKSLDQNVKEMLQLLEQDGDLAAGENIDNDQRKQSDLIARVEEISHRHHLLADHYNKLTGYLNSDSHLPTYGVKNYDKTQLSTPFFTPYKKLPMHSVEGSDLSLSSGGGISDATPNEGSQSSSLSSDSDSESCNSSPNERSTSLASGKMPKHEIVNVESEIGNLNKQDEVYATLTVGEYETLLKRISEYEKESGISNQKVQLAEEEIAKLKSELQNNETVIVKMGSLEAELASAKNQIKLYEDENDKENKRSLMLQRQIIDLEEKLESEKRQVWELQDSVTRYTTQLSDRGHEIRKLSAELHDASGNFALEKWQLESRVSELSESLTFQEARAIELQMESELFTYEIKKCKSEKDELERKQEALTMNLQENIEQTKAELRKKNVLIDNLNENLDGLKLMYDMLMAEKDGVNAKLQTLDAELSHRDNQIQVLDNNLCGLQSENKRLTAATDSANKLTAELKLRIDELEREVERQSVVIKEREEEKREAIRQLCLAIDHYRSMYEEICDAFVMRKRPTAVAA